MQQNFAEYIYAVATYMADHLGTPCHAAAAGFLSVLTQKQYRVSPSWVSVVPVTPVQPKPVLHNIEAEEFFKKHSSVQTITKKPKLQMLFL